MAAVGEGWLAGVPGDIEELRIVMSAAGVTDVDELETVLDDHEDEFEELQSALRLRRPGSTRGDLAHWAGVSLLAFVETFPERAALPATARWDDDYLDDIEELRGVAARDNLGGLGEAEFVVADAPPEGLIFKPGSWSTTLRALEDHVGWPLFPVPGSQGLIGARALAEGEILDSSDYRLQVRRAGFARARSDYVQVVARYTLADDGSLDFLDSWNLVLRADQTVTVLAIGTGSRPKLWIWGGEGRVIPVPADCCFPADNLDTLLWVRLGWDDADPWTMAPEETFETVPWQELNAMRMAEAAERGSEPVYFKPLGRILSNSDRPEIAGARLSVYRAGNPEGDPLFVVHGEPGLGSRYLRDPLARTIGSTHQLVFWDQRGAGYSDGADDPTGITMRRMVDDMERLRRRAELEQLDVLAHGFGALIAVHYEAAYPGRIGKLVLVDPDPISRNEWDRVSSTRPELSFEEAEHCGLVADEFVRTNIEATAELVRIDLGDWDVTELLAGIEASTLIVAGAEAAPEVATRYHAALPESELVILPRAGRFSYADARVQFLEAALALLLSE